MYDVRIYQMAMELARMAIEAGDLQRAESVAREVELAAVNSNENDSFVRGLALSTRGRCLFLTNRAAEAEPLVREGLKLMNAHVKNECQTHATRILLGQILVAQGRYSEAEPELKAGYSESKKLGHKLLFATRRRLPDALEALAQCADALDRPAEVANYRAENSRWVNSDQR